MTTVADLLEALEDAPPDAKVRVAYQPSWPLRATLAGVVTPDDAAAHDAPACVECHSTDDVVPDDRGRWFCVSCGVTFAAPGEPSTDAGFVWLVVADGHAGYDESPYAPSWLWEDAR